MPLTNPNKVVTEQRLADFYGEMVQYTKTSESNSE